MVQTPANLPVSEWVCLMVDEEVIRCVDGDLMNEYGKGPYVKAIERLPAICPDYGGSLKFLPPKRRKTGERPIYNGYWLEDVEMESLGIDPDEIPALEDGLGHASEENRDVTESRYPPKVTLDSALEPLTDSLKGLDISIPYSSSAPEGGGLYLSSRSPTAFKSLRDLYVPKAFLNERHGFDGTRPWFPASLLSLGFSNAWPSSYARSPREFNCVAVAVPFEHTVDSDKVDVITRGGSCSSLSDAGVFTMFYYD
ncbi:hypothetical protein BJX62DRAFT_236409 [Aspergillus germanicus]